MSEIHRFQKNRLGTILSVKPLRIREGLYKQLREREWIFNRVENSLIFLIHKNGAYGVVVEFEDIDWNELWEKPTPQRGEAIKEGNDHV